MDDLESLINLTCMFLDGGRKVADRSRDNNVISYVSTFYRIIQMIIMIIQMLLL